MSLLSVGSSQFYRLVYTHHVWRSTGNVCMEECFDIIEMV